MKLAMRNRGTVWVILLSLAAVSAGYASDKDKDKKEQPKAAVQVVDSGSFGVFVNQQRVATETFSVEQQNAASSIKSQLKETAGNSPAVQKSDLEMSPAGELVRYDWSQAAGGSLTVMPNNDFLLEKISTAAYSKPAEQSFLLPSTSSILDNNFFIHREILAWRYLAANCKQESEGMKCPHVPGDFGVLVPQDRTSMHVRLELVGKEKVSIRGTERELLRLNLSGDNVQWALWVDDKDHFKLMRVTIPADNTEVVRD